jgi:hypothetical protein
MADILSLQEANVCAKNFENFQGICMAVTLHPEWLTEIPTGRRWAILHHVVYSGNIGHLNQLLAKQDNNNNFRLLSPTAEKETVLDVAKLRDNQSGMLQHIERLVKLDELLNYAKDKKWDKCYEIVKANPRYGNEKPPYRQFYLIHHMACVDAIDEFEQFEKIENFKFDLTVRANRKKINAVAREHRGQNFAKYIEEKCAAFFSDDDNLFEPTPQSKQHTNHVNTLMEQRPAFFESEPLFAPAQNVVTRGEVDKEVQHKLGKKPPPKITAKNPVTNHSIDAIRSILTCPLTDAIVTDPGKYCDHRILLSILCSCCC